jgi:hypothetical protein
MYGSVYPILTHGKIGGDGQYNAAGVNGRYLHDTLFSATVDQNVEDKVYSRHFDRHVPASQHRTFFVGFVRRLYQFPAHNRHERRHARLFVHRPCLEDTARMIHTRPTYSPA